MSVGKDVLRRALLEMGRRYDVIRDTHGNLSCRDGDVVHIKPSGVPYGDFVTADVCTVDLQTGDARDTRGFKPSVDTPHHLSIYRRHPWVKAICHTHSPYATAFAWAERPLACVGTEHADYFGHLIRCLPYSGLDTWGDEVSLLEGERAILLGRHGTLTFGRNVMHAVDLAVALENVFQKAYLANSLACVIPPLPEDEVARWHGRYNGGGYGQ